MENYTRKAMVLIVSVIFIAIFITGCDEQDVSDTKKARLIAQENRQLKAQITQLNNDITKLQGQLADCQVQNKGLEEIAQEGAEKTLGVFFETVGKENQALQQENEELKKLLKQQQQ